MERRSVHMIGLLSLIALSLLSAASVQAAEPISLLEFARSNGLLLEWEPSLEMGRLRRGTNALWFTPGLEWMSTSDGRLEPMPAVIRRGGDLMMTDASAAALRSFFRLNARGDSPRVAAIVIDPGHGGKDPGTIGRHMVDGRQLVVQEKDIVLTVAHELRKLLVRTFPDKQILLSRSEDVFLSLEERTAFANSVEVAAEDSIIFVSIHANASFNTRARGFEVWYLPPEYRRDLIDPRTVDTEHRAILPILNSMLEEEFTIESILLARYISESMDATLGTKTENRGLKNQSWFVVRKAKMPSVLVEIGFVTNREEALRLSDEGHLNRIAAAIYNGIVNFVTYHDTVHRRGERR